ncbi:MAG: hypothetical protein JJE21_08435, partial [Spirochaetaceae bacterium]|nr:hypothetical protein [Spirochaetaceae bacterium]
MKKFIVSLLFLLLTINLYSSDNYTIAIVPLIQNATVMDKVSFDDVTSITNSIFEKTISDINSSACEEVLSIFNKYLINSMSLNEAQKFSYLKNKYEVEIEVDKAQLSSYYVEIANNNYSTYDSFSHKTKIDELKTKIDLESKQLSKFKSTTNVDNTLQIDYPSNLNNSNTTTKSKNIIDVKIYKNFIDSFLLSNYNDFYTPIFQKGNSINEIIFVEVDRLNNFNNLKIYSNNLKDSNKVLIFDKIIANDSIPSLSPYILESLINFYFKDLTIVKNNIDKSNIVIKEIKNESILKELKAQEEINNTINQSDLIINFDISKIKFSDCVDLSNTSTYLIL